MSSDPSASLKTWIEDFFETTWARTVGMAIWILVSAWIWFGAAPAVLDEQPAPLPLSWYSQQANAVGWQLPSWYERITDWRSPDGIWWPQVALMVAVVMLSVVSATKFAAGYRVGATILLLVSMQWFGVSNTLLIFISSVAGLFVITQTLNWINQRRDGDEREAPYSYDPEIVMGHILSGPVFLIGMPAVLPIAGLILAIHSIGFDRSQMIDPIEVRTVTRAIDLASPNAGSAAELSARELATIIASSQLIASCDGKTRHDAARQIHLGYQQRTVDHGGPARSLFRPPV